MKYLKKRPLIVLFGICLITIGLVGACATKNPNAGKPIIDPATGQTNGVEPGYLPNATVGTIGKTGNQIAPFIPAPYGDLLTLGLGLATTITGLIAKSKNGQLAAVVQGVEDGTSQPTVTAASVKTAIQARATAAGVQPALDTTVRKLT